MAQLTIQMIRDAVEKLRNSNYKSPEPIVLEYINCTECGVRYGLMDFHDCLGMYDALRIVNGVSTNSVRARFRKKYGIHSDEGEKMMEAAREEIDGLGPREFTRLNDEYVMKMRFISSPSERELQLEEELWNA